MAAQCKKCKKIAWSTKEGYCSECFNEINGITTSNEEQISKNHRDLSETDYGVSVGFSKFVAFVGWAVIALGVIALLMIFKEGELAFLMLSSVLVAIVFGFLLVIAGQTSRAILDNANYSRQMLIEMRRSNKE